VVLRLRLLGLDDPTILGLKKLGQARLPTTELEDYFAEVMRPIFMPFPPGEELAEFRVDVDEEKGEAVIEARTSTGEAYRARCRETGRYVVCWPTPSRGTP